MKDMICIDGLEVFARHGVYPEENENGQTFIVCAEMAADFTKAAENDDLEESTDYGAVCRFITEFMQKNTYKLIETAAVRLAEAILDTFPLLFGVRLRIEKPEAPIGLPFDTVAVETERAWHRAYIALGSNMGDKEAYLDGAVDALGRTRGIRMGEVSDHLVTAPYGGVEQDDYLNAVLWADTYHSPERLLDILHGIEADADRVREIRWGPRTLDLDILLYDDLVLDTPDLHIPHIDMHNRDFVLRPLSQIAPYVRHPVLRKTAGELPAELPYSTEKCTSGPDILLQYFKV